LDVAKAVALSLLEQVVDIVSGKRSDGIELGRLQSELAAASQRLGDQVEDSAKLRRRLRETEDELVATKRERDGLRQRLRAAEHNLSVATGADVRRVIDAEVHKRVAQVMREVPVGPTSHVND
jgi:chromosome segregation ATPase